MAEEYSNVTQLFSEIANRLRSFPVPNSANQTNNINSVTQASPTVVNSSTNSTLNESASHASTSSMVSRTHSELQTLFPHHFTSTSSQRHSSDSSSRKRRKNNQHNRKDSKKSSVKCLTRKFVCLSDKDQQKVPEREEMRELLVHGLGEVKVAIPEDANEKAIRNKLIETFPKLKDSGGFELMYVECRKKDLSVIPPGPDGLSMKYLQSWTNYLGRTCKKQHFLKIYHISFTKSTPSPRNNVDVHLNYHGKNWDTCGNNIVTGERGIRVYTRLNN